MGFPPPRIDQGLMLDALLKVANKELKDGRIRLAQRSDLHNLYEIGRFSKDLRVEEDSFVDVRDLEFFIQNEDGLFLVAEKEGEIIGFSYVQREAPTYGALVYNYMKPEHRGKGFGTKMLKIREAYMRNMGVESLYALVTNRHAVDFMYSMGYNKGKKLTWMEKKL